MKSIASSSSKLPLFSVAPKLSPEPTGLSTPPLQTSASVPFQWEQEPGKPIPCTALIIPTYNKCLELPPRLQPVEYSRLFTKTPSPTTVLDGPYVGKNVISSSSSFRIFSSSKRQDSCNSHFSGRFSPERVQIGTLLLGEKKGKKGLFGNSWGQRQKSFKLKGSMEEYGSEASFVFSPSLYHESPTEKEEEDENESDNNSTTSTKVKRTKFRRSGSFSNLSHAKSHFWTAMCEGIKHAIPWKSRKSKKQVHVV